MGPQELLLATVKSWKLTRFGHVTQHNSETTMLQGTLAGPDQGDGERGVPEQARVQGLRKPQGGCRDNIPAGGLPDTVEF